MFKLIRTIATQFYIHNFAEDVATATGNTFVAELDKQLLFYQLADGTLAAKVMARMDIRANGHIIDMPRQDSGYIPLWEAVALFVQVDLRKPWLEIDNKLRSAWPTRKNGERIGVEPSPKREVLGIYWR